MQILFLFVVDGVVVAAQIAVIIFPSIYNSIFVLSFNARHSTRYTNTFTTETAT